MSQALRDKYAIVGIGQSELGELPGRSAFDLFTDAVLAAVADAGLGRADIDGLVCRGPDDIYCFHQRMGERLGLDVGFSTTVDNGGASQIVSVILAVMAIEAGLCETVVCGYGRVARSPRADLAQRCTDCDRLRWPAGLVCPCCWGRRWDWTDLVGRDGEVHSVVTYRRAFHSSVVDDVPYSMAVVSVESARVLARVAEPEAVEVGSQVRLVATDSEKPSTRVVLVRA